MRTSDVCDVLSESPPSVDPCSAHEHLEINAVDEVVDIPVDTLFQHIFTDSVVFRNFLNTRKTFGEYSSII